jgi:hypothetical protein
LLAHWLARLEQAQGLHIIYFPISVRFNTNLPTVVFASLAARMAHCYSEKVIEATDAELYPGVFSDYLRHVPKDGWRVLVILDGLDETAGWQMGADLFPTVPPEHLRVLVAARTLGNEQNERGWLSRLNCLSSNFDDPALEFLIGSTITGLKFNFWEEDRIVSEPVIASRARYSIARSAFGRANDHFVGGDDTTRRGLSPLSRVF